MSNRRSLLKQRRELALSLAEALVAPGMPPDAAAWAAMMADDIHLRIGPRPVAIGRDAALAELAPMLDDVAVFGARFFCLWAAPDAATVMVETDLVRHAAKPPLPVAIVLRAAGAGGAIRDLRFYLDLTPFDWTDSRKSEE